MIKGVAIKQDGVTYKLPKPKRHEDVIEYMVNVQHITAPITGEQGFYNSRGSFLDRKSAYKDAVASKQLVDTLGPAILYSDDLW